MPVLKITPPNGRQGPMLTTVASIEATRPQHGDRQQPPPRRPSIKTRGGGEHPLWVIKIAPPAPVFEGPVHMSFLCHPNHRLAEMLKHYA